MASYNTIRGLRVKYLSADPANPEQGQVWYNSTTGNLRVNGILSDAFSAGGNTSVARPQAGGSAGVQTAAIIFSGNAIPQTEAYNGSSWTGGGAVSAARYGGSSGGTSTAAFFGGGSVPAGSPGPGATEEYDGSSWSGGGAMNVARKYFAGCGTLTAGLAGGGGYPPPTRAATEEYDGSSWTNGGNLNTGNYGVSIMASGTQTAALCAGGNARTTNTESYNGSTWTNVGAMNQGRAFGGASGTQTLGIAFGGDIGTGALTNTENWNGSAWSANAATLAVGRGGLSSASVGLKASAIAMAGGNPANPAANTATEEFGEISGIETVSVS
tara:strand:+ start:126 stop:1106 length:981 start_codon:yes stop_codon:yes gene_type:complete